MSSNRPSTAAVGWSAFAAIMMLVIGVWWVIAGIAGIAKDQVFVLTANYVFKFDVTAWGWIHLILGILVFLAGLGLFSGATWARAVGVVLAAISGVIGFAWLPWYPFWGIVIVVASVYVIWALVAHGHDLAAVND